MRVSVLGAQCRCDSAECSRLGDSRAEALASEQVKMEVIDRLPRVTSGIRHDSIASLDDSRLSGDFNRGANQSSR